MAGIQRARAASASDAAPPLPREAVVLGAGQGGDPVLLDDRQLSAHGLILGASGAGKSTTLLRILTDHVRRGRPVVAIDLKGSPAFARELADAAAEAGRPFALWTPDGPGYWNPLAHGNATELKDKLIATERFTEPHYQRAAERFVQTVLQVLQASHPAQPPTLEEVVRMMDPRRLAGELRHLPRDHAQRVQDYLSELTPDQLSAIRGMGTRLAILSESHTGPYLGPGSGAPSGAAGVGAPSGGVAVTGAGAPSAGVALMGMGGARPHEIDLRAALAGDQVVLFSLNSSTYGKLSAQLGTLVVQDLVTAVGHRLTLPERQPALIAIDEFSALGADNVISLLARGREAGASVMLATQELADLDRAARGLRDQVLGNTAVKIAHRQDVPSSAQAIAEMAGTEKTWQQTYQVGSRPLLGRYDTGRGTRREAEQFVVHPNDIKRLPTGHAVLITKQPVASARTVRVAPPRARDGREL
ncbi:MAG: type IV secretion system DNA-binding domain-containing protein [Solirubrobacteraceae bacterium]